MQGSSNSSHAGAKKTNGLKRIRDRRTGQSVIELSGGLHPQSGSHASDEQRNELETLIRIEIIAAANYV